LALARCAPVLANHRVELIVVDGGRRHASDSLDFIAGRRRWAALARSKLILNIHRGELSYLEWLRVVGAVANGCVVVSEHATGLGPLVPGEHFISVGCDRLPLALQALLSDPDRIAEVRERAYRFLREELSLERTVTPLAEAVAELAVTRPERGALVPAPVPPSPHETSPQPTAAERLATHADENAVLRAAVKDLTLGQLELRRQVVRLQTSGRQSERADEVEHRGSRERPVGVSVLVSVYNYARHVADALASVAASDLEDYEVIVVDDCSSDGSLAVVRAELESRPWLASTLVSRWENRGLAAARNCALEHARGDLVFMLDADNEVYPHALRRLAETLEENPSACFAYGILEQFGPEGPRGLINWPAWDPARLRYGNYVDAMAMVRRRSLVEVGGYTEDPRLYGWEDFALWCAFASRGSYGVRLPEIVARYRAAPRSMTSITNLDTSVAWGALIERHPFLRETPAGLSFGGALA
jgi:hypothetical protein